MVKNINPNKLKKILKEANQSYKKFVEEEIPQPRKVLEWKKDKGKPTILVLYTGGTLGMRLQKDRKTGKDKLVPKLSLKELLNIADKVTGIKKKYNIIGFKISHIDSTEINVKIWDNIANLIKKYYDKVDGVVIAHGTDTMAYSAAALSFTMRKLAIPIVFTGAQMTLEKDGTDVIGNLTGAIKVASSDIAEVVVYFNGSIFRGNRVDKIHDSNLDGFASTIFGPIGKLGANGVNLDPRAVRRGRYIRKDLIFEPGFITSVMEIVLSPLSRPEEIGQAIMAENCEALVIRSYGPGNAPRWYHKLINYLTNEANFPVIISSQCAGSGISQESSYSVGVEGLSIGDMSAPATVAKFMKVRSKTEDLKKVYHEMKRVSYAGEISLNDK